MRAEKGVLVAQLTLERVEQPVVVRPRTGGGRRIVREVGLLAVLFGAYNLGRFLSADHAGSAYRHADKLIGWEAWLGLPSEATVQQQALQIPGLAEAANVFYASVHFPLTAAVLVWLMIRRPAEYGKARWALAALTGLALVGHMFFPLAPPRMMPGWVDTGVLLGQSVYGPTTDSGVANQFAAMPSLHVGWAFMVAVFLIRATHSRWRWLWMAHPVLTFAVVVVTANHYWLDGLVAIALALPLLLVFDAGRVRRLKNAPAGFDQRLDKVPAVASSSSARTR
ncbi:phosphatase PAP2 family protein [Kribbella sp. NPDC050820]|uniref:phosphatase PAP2 family protein n=1 Tax=Kribbella sp. NPDC050820 TaxID=3155408 RepID=UPI00340C7763